MGSTISFFFQQLGFGFWGKIEWGILNGEENDKPPLMNFKGSNKKLLGRQLLWQLLEDDVRKREKEEDNYQ